MSVYKEVQYLEQELFKLLEHAFEYANFKNYAKLSVSLEAMKQLESEYYEITKKNYIKPENILRLNAAHTDIKHNYDKYEKELNDILKKLK